MIGLVLWAAACVLAHLMDLLEHLLEALICCQRCMVRVAMAVSVGITLCTLQVSVLHGVWEVLFKFLLAVFSNARPQVTCAGALNDLLGRPAVAGPEGSMRSV